MMKNWKCPNCKNEAITDDDIKMKMCRCGWWYEEVKDGR